MRKCRGGRNELSILRSVEKTERISGIAPHAKRGRLICSHVKSCCN
jgi:hypothetical protein